MDEFFSQINDTTNTILIFSNDKYAVGTYNISFMLTALIEGESMN